MQLISASTALYGTESIFDVDGLNVGLFIIRVVVGLTILAHAYNHIWGGGKIAGTAGWFASMGLRPGILHAWMASVTEVAAGVLLVLGLLTPIGAAGLVGIMLVAGITAHRQNGYFIFKPGQGWEYVAVLGAVSMALGATGPGEWSLDNAIGLDSLVGTTGLAISGIGGIGGAMLLLLAFWRPGAGGGEG